MKEDQASLEADQSDDEILNNDDLDGERNGEVKRVIDCMGCVWPLNVYSERLVNEV